MDQERVIALLNQLKTEADSIRDNNSQNTWKANAKSIFARIYGANYDGLNSIDQNLQRIVLFSGRPTAGDFNEHKQFAIDFTQSRIDEIQALGLPENLLEPATKIDITQNQAVRVNVSMLLDSLREHLDEGQLVEVQGILEDKGLKTDEKKVRVIEKLKTFGADLAQNVLANILVNPLFAG